MEHLNEDKTMIFDRFYSNDNLALLKVFSFFMEEGQRPMIAVMIKYMELGLCIRNMQKHQVPKCHCACHTNGVGDITEILKEVSDYLPPEGRDMMDQLKNMQETMETYSQMMEMMNLMQSCENDENNSSK